MLSCFYLRFFINIGMVHKTLLSSSFFNSIIFESGQVFFFGILCFTQLVAIKSPPPHHFTWEHSFSPIIRRFSPRLLPWPSIQLRNRLWVWLDEYEVILSCTFLCGEKEKKKGRNINKQVFEKKCHHSTNKPHGPLTRHERSRERLANCSNLCGFVEFFSMFLGSVYVFLTQWPCSCTNSKKQST